MYYPTTVLASAIIFMVVTFWLLNYYEHHLEIDQFTWSYQNNLLQILQGELAPVSYKVPSIRPNAVLIVGVSGLVGSHLASQLSKQGTQVVGVDIIFDGYNDGRLKISRLENLRKDRLLVTILQGDACTHSLMQDLWTRYNFTKVFFLSSKQRTTIFCNCLTLYQELASLDSSPASLQQKLPFYYSSSLLEDIVKCAPTTLPTNPPTPPTLKGNASIIYPPLTALDRVCISFPDKILGAWQYYDSSGDYGTVTGVYGYVYGYSWYLYGVWCMCH
ncbi:NAD-dependent epimerase/dehydratase family protein [archaeon]|nr:MAG: NAD-dependent epimerase/dehydratase family protein [archaeon]